jgi:hypothetical protein
MPHLLLFGSSPSIPLEIIHNREHAPKEWNDTHLPDQTEYLKQAAQRIQAAHEYNAARYNNKQRPHNFKVGDKVIFLKTLRSKKDIFHKKLALPGEGPFKIITINLKGSRATISVDGKLTEVNTANLVPYQRRPDWMLAPELRELANSQDGDTQSTDTKRMEPIPITDTNQAIEWQTGDCVDVLVSGEIRNGHIVYLKDSAAYLKGKGLNGWFDTSLLSQHLHTDDEISQHLPKELRDTRNPRKKRRTTRVAHGLYLTEAK